MDEDIWLIDIPKTLEAWEDGRHDDIESALDEDLSGQVSDFLDDVCESGGWPEDEQVEIGEVQITRDRITAEVNVYFNETVASSCKDINHQQRREARLVLHLNRGDSKATVERSATDRTEWDIQDRNSAADGT